MRPFGSDVIADALRSLDIPYIALTPGASYRGLHDSIVNYLGNSSPQMLLCLHEKRPSLSSRLCKSYRQRPWPPRSIPMSG